MGSDPDARTVLADTVAATPATTGEASTVAHGIAGTPAELVEVADDAYAVGRELARGGMGRIFEAFDRRHGRPVAIKMLLRGGDDALARFVREATITSRLQHPAIVPVYEAGRWPTGEPFFAMKLVEGRSLDRAIEDAPDLAARLALLPKLIAVTEALAYAHRHGVIHRDLKPLNVLCGDYGETVVIDWGLAKHVAAADSRSTDAGSPSDDGLTVAGAAMGTPRYMSPEQARGVSVDEKSDVYALGAMLYHLVAGSAPYEGTTGSGIDRVIEGPPAPLAERVPDAPPDLCTIVAKAMARAPADRYATAAELAAELRRFASGRRVAAHDYSLAALVRRFVARHRVTVAVAAVLVAALAVTSVVSMRRIMRERNNARTERGVAVAARKEALAERAAAEELVDFIQSDLRERLDPIGRIELLEGVGSRVAAYYEQTGSDDLAAKARRASALSLDGEIAVITDDIPRADASLDAALALREELAKARPDDAAAQRELALAGLELAKNRIERKDPYGATAKFDKALTAARKAIALAPADVRNQVALSYVLSRFATYLDSTGVATNAAPMLAESLAIARAIVAAHPEHRSILAEILELTAGSQRQGGDYESGRRATEEALAIRRDLVELAPRDTRRQAALARTHRLLAGAYTDVESMTAALAQYREERAILERLLTIEPDNTRWQHFLAENHLDVGDRIRDEDDFKGAAREYLAGLAIAERRARKLSDDGHAQFTLANFHSALGDLLAVQKDRGAIEHFEVAQGIVDDLRAKSPTNMRWRFAAARTRGGAANGLVELGQRSMAHAEFGRALDDLDTMIAEEPDAAVYHNLRTELAMLAAQNLSEDPRASANDLQAAARRALAALDALRNKAPVPERLLDYENELKQIAGD